VGWEGGGGEATACLFALPTVENLTSIHDDSLFTPPLFEIENYCLRLQAGPIYRAILLISAGLIQPIPIIIGQPH
jgi:hypothetical protein